MSEGTDGQQRGDGREAAATAGASGTLADLLFFNHPLPLWIFDRETLRFLDVNDAAVRQYGWSREEFLAMRILDIRPPEDAARLSEALRRPLEATGRRGIWRHTRKDGTRLDVEIVSHPLRYQGRPATLVLARDITERKRIEEALRRSEERYRAIVSTTPNVAIEGFDRQGRVLFWNGAAERLFGWSEQEAIGRTLDELILDPASAAEFMAALRAIEETREPLGPAEWRFRAKDGREGVVVATIFAIPAHGGGTEFICMDVDVTDRKVLERQLLQAQKLESVGRLAGGIAHDFNNLLTAILGYAELAAGAVEGDARATGWVAEIRSAAERAGALTRQLLTFARRQVIEPEVVDVNELTSDLERMLRRVIGEDIQLVTELEARAPTVRADAGQLEQVLLNLAVNARDAMPDGGRLTIRTRDVVLGEGDLATRPGLVPGPYVAIEAIDTGVGMSEEVLAHLFEPFFTTKELGKGTGLGLATCYGIVTQCGGRIEADSEPGRGATFRILLPCENASSGLGTAGGPPTSARPAEPAGEVVLIAEDEVRVRDIMAQTLRSEGYRVLLAEDGEAALRLAREHAGEIALVVTDVVMPRLSGPDLVERLRAHRPALRVLYASGYAADRVPALAGPDTAFLQKPFTPAELARRVRSLLGS